MTCALTAAVVLLLPLSISGEVTLKHGSLEVKVPENATKAQQKQALLEAFTDQEEALANKLVNDISTHQWSLMVEEYGEAKPRKKGEAPKIEAWFINEMKETEKARCMEKQLKSAGFAPLRFEAVGHSKEDLAECTANGVHESMKDLSKHETMRELRNWCSHKHLLNALSSAEASGEADFFLILEDGAAIHDRNLKTMVDALIKDLSDPNIAKFANVKNFDFVQLDPYGGIGWPVGFYQGRPLYSPSADKLGASQGAYQGSHALLVKRSAVAKLHDWMGQSKAMRMDAVPQAMPEFIAVAAGVVHNVKSPFYTSSTASRSCKAGASETDSQKPENMFQLGPDAVKAWWLPKEEPKLQVKQEVEQVSKPTEEEKPQVRAEVETKTKASFLR